MNFSEAFFENLFECHAVCILHHAVIGHDGKFAVGEDHVDEEIVRFPARVIRIFGLHLAAKFGARFAPVMAIGNIESIEPGEGGDDVLYHLVIVDYPELVTDTVIGHEIDRRLHRRVPS